MEGQISGHAGRAWPFCRDGQRTELCRVGSADMQTVSSKWVTLSITNPPFVCISESTLETGIRVPLYPPPGHQSESAAERAMVRGRN